MRKDQRALLIAMSLGDGHIQVYRHKRKRPLANNKIAWYDTELARLVLHHSRKQLEYVKYKAKLLQSIFGGKELKVLLTEQYLKKTGKTYLMAKVSKNNPYFKFLRRWVYPNGIKTYTYGLLLELTPHALAIWYMDDGYTKFNLNKYKLPSTVQASIATYCTEEEAIEICKYFWDIYKIEFKPHIHKSCGKYIISANTKNSNKFFDIIKSYIIPSMLYKIQYVPRAPNVPRRDDDIGST